MSAEILPSMLSVEEKSFSMQSLIFSWRLFCSGWSVFELRLQCTVHKATSSGNAQCIIQQSVVFFFLYKTIFIVSECLVSPSVSHVKCFMIFTSFLVPLDHVHWLWFYHGKYYFSMNNACYDAQTGLDRSCLYYLSSDTFCCLRIYIRSFNLYHPLG